MIDTEKLLLMKLTEIQHSIKGLLMQVEGWRVHTSSMGDFIIAEVEELQRAVAELKTKLHDTGPSVNPKTP